ncbi:hypothetical protein RV12_GL000198 [Enterococcus quebecensis]|nr:hypothetical protein RV12_GL000198 [Enterococcus quebecensis]
MFLRYLIEKLFNKSKLKATYLLNSQTCHFYLTITQID